jgi:tRNA/rRNA methyltransferase
MCQKVEIVFILVEPAIPGNIGSTARAINTMGYSSLRLVSPGDYLGEEALKFAHGSTELLKKALVFSSFEEATRDIDFLIATTAKKRSAAQDYYSCGQLPGLIKKKGTAILTAGLVFGKEESGLPNRIIKKCDVVSYIPMNSVYPSLNLSQAVMIYAYTLFSEGCESRSVTRRVTSNNESLNSLKIKVIRLLALTRMDENQTLTRRVLERIMAMGEEDIHLAHSLCNRLLDTLGQDDR